MSGAAEGISPIDVINYFCEMKLEAELAKLKAEAAKRKEMDDKKDKNKNTILMMPKKEGLVSFCFLFICFVYYFRQCLHDQPKMIDYQARTYQCVAKNFATKPSYFFRFKTLT